MSFKIIYAMFLIIPVQILAQDTIKLPKKEDHIFYEQVISLDSQTSKNTIYNFVKLWVAQSFNSVKDAIQLDDKELGKILVKGYYEYTVPGGPSGISDERQGVRFLMNLDAKDGKYRVQLYNFEMPGLTWTPEKEYDYYLTHMNKVQSKYRQKLWQLFDESNTNLISSLQNFITKQINEQKQF